MDRFDIIEKALEEFAELQPNMASESARKIITSAIIKALQDAEASALAKDNKN